MLLASCLSTLVPFVTSQLASMKTRTRNFAIFLIFEVSILFTGWPETLIIVRNSAEDIFARHISVAGAQLQRPLARPHLPGD